MKFHLITIIITLAIITIIIIIAVSTVIVIIITPFLLNLSFLILNDLYIFLECYFPVVPLGSLPELPAESCSEIKASEGVAAKSSLYWLDLDRSGNSIQVYCDMINEGLFLRKYVLKHIYI